MPIRLNDRLKQIASYIKKGESVCDVGTDHGFLPIYLFENNISEKIIMSDVSKGSIEKAVSDAKEELGDLNRIDARYGDGFDVLEPGEVDDIVIAGMGGLQILDIMTWDITKTLTYKKFIFQPRRDAAVLRKWLDINGFTIVEQVVVPENGRYSEIICCTSEMAASVNISFYDRKNTLEIFNGNPTEWVSYEYPETLKDPKNAGIDKKYFASELDKQKMITEKIRANSDSQNEMLEVFDKRIERLEYLCGKKN